MEFSPKDVLFRIESIIAEHGIKEVDFCRSIGASLTSVTDWRRRGQCPNASTLFAISKRYNVSIDYLLTGKDQVTVARDLNFNNLRERSLMEKFRQLPPDLQDMTLNYLDGMLKVVNKNKEAVVS